MTFDRLADAEKHSMKHLARAVLDQLQAGRPKEDIVRELHSMDWPLEEANEFVDKLDERQDDYSEKLAIRFPEMKPVRRQPRLFSINGIGTIMYGMRSRDRESGTYVKTHCLCFVFLPILALGAYRVAKVAGHDGWFLLGKVPLSRLARFWNCGVLISVVGIAVVSFWNQHTDSREYIAAQKMEQAEDLVAEGKLLPACRLYRNLAQGSSSQRDEARQLLLAMIDSPRLGDLPPVDVAEIFENAVLGNNADRASDFFQYVAGWVRIFSDSDPSAAAEMLRVIWESSPSDALQLFGELSTGPFAELDTDLFREVYSVLLGALSDVDDRKSIIQCAQPWIKRHSTDDPVKTLEAADFLASFLPEPFAELESVRGPLLEQAVAAQPQDADLAVRLAISWETTGQLQRVKKLLTPLKDQLGSGEGARLLGSTLADEGQFDQAYELLNAYIEPRLSALHDAEAAFEQAVEQCRQRVLRQLQMGYASGFDYDRYDDTPKEDQQLMVMEYLARETRTDGGVNGARMALRQHAAVVPVAMDLGIVTLRRAQTMTDAEARRKELEKAEKTFLAIRGIAGDDQAYQLRIGQVYYWLGKKDEGKQQFDQLLETSQHSFGALMGVAQVLREIGAFEEARSRLEEAYEKASDDESRQAAAHLRALTSDGVADELMWLERSNQVEPNVRAELHSVRGHQARQAGDREKAASHYRLAIAAYDKMPDSSATLNNAGLVCLALYGVSSDPDALNDGIVRMEKAVKLRPGNAILLLNVADALTQSAVRRLAGEDPELDGVASFSRFGILDFVVRSEDDVNRLLATARTDEQLQSALAYFEKAAIMAPQNPAPFLRLHNIYTFLKDEDGLRRFVEQTHTTTFDTAAALTDQVSFFTFQESDSARAELSRVLTDATKKMEALRKSRHGNAYAASVENVVSQAVRLPDLSTVDVDRLVQLADEAYAAAPSRGSGSTVVSALALRAHQTLARSFPEYASASESVRRSLGPPITVALALSHPTGLGEAARKDPDVIRMADLARQRIGKFPSLRTPWAWAMFHELSPPAADDVAKHMQLDQISQLSRKAMLNMPFPSTAYACYEYWALLAQGRKKEARAVFESSTKLGIEVPSYLLAGDRIEQ